MLIVDKDDIPEEWLQYFETVHSIDCPVRLLDEQTQNVKTTKPHPVKSNVEKYDGWESITKKQGEVVNYDEANIAGASRFFYCSKAPKRERWFYCKKCEDAFEMKQWDEHRHGVPKDERLEHLVVHPVIKPVSLMRYLVRLITPPNGIVLDPFLGTGSTLIACEMEGFNGIGIEQDPYYFKIAEKRLGDHNASKIHRRSVKDLFS